jgi:hypothetical protein
MAYKPKVLTVSEGGSAVVSNTSYAVLCGGTTSTGSIQSIAALGTSGDVLTSNGAGALPTFQAASSGGLGFILSVQTSDGAPADSTTYYMQESQQMDSATTSNIASVQYVIPVNCTLTKCYGTITVIGTLASTENSTLSIRVNDTTDTTVTSTLKMNAASNTFSNTGLSISLSAGDFISFKLATPAWGTNPTFTNFSASVYLS